MINTWLFRRLKYLFGEVKIANEDLPLIFSEYIEPTTGKKKIFVEQRGETYCVNCPFCQIVTNGRPDTRFRLWINHHYGVEDPSTKRKFWGLAYCYNENCLSYEEFRTALKHIIYGFEKPPTNLDLQFRSRTLARTRCELPAGLVPINSLEASHPAAQYLISENFDLDYLYNTFKIQFAAELDPRFPNMYGRIIIPIYMNGELYGYQGRILGKQGNLRYLTAKGTKVGEVLYGYDAFPKGLQFAVLFEGAKDVWRYGPGALGMLGTHLSRRQVMLLKELGIKYAIVILDGDIATNRHSMRIINSLNAALNSSGLKYSIRILPDGKDPADLDREKLYEYILEYASGLDC